MKEYLIGYTKNGEQAVIFFDIQDFEKQEIRGMTILTFSEDNIDYTYTGTNGRDFSEISNKAPEFHRYEILDETECKRRGISTDPGPNSTQANNNNTQGSKSININNGIKITLSTGKTVDVLSPSDMSNLTPAEANELRKELTKKLGGTTAKAKKNLNSIFGGSSGGSKGKYKVVVDFTKNSQNPTVLLPNGGAYTKDDLENMDINEIIDWAETDGIDVSDILSEINAAIFKGTKGRITLTLDKATNIFGSSSSSSSGSSCGGGYSGSSCGSGSYGGCSSGSYGGC